MERIKAVGEVIHKSRQPLPILWAMNRKANTVVIMTGCSCFEELKGWFRVGILLPDGNSADAIGRSKSLSDFQRKAANGATRIMED